MTQEERLTINERRKYLRKMQPLYHNASRQQRTALLTEMQIVTGLHRKSLIRLLRTDLQRKPRTRQRGPSYPAPVRDAVRLCAHALDYPAAERLQPVLVDTAQDLARHGHLHLTDAILHALGRISVSTVRRIVGPVTREPRRIASPRKPKRRRSTHKRVPVRIIPNTTDQPGYLEADTVQHSGPDARGQFAYTLCLTDVATGWVGTYATLGNSHKVIHDAFQAIQQALPFKIQEIHTDNGTEFLNQAVKTWIQSQATHSRSRPYHKNDNRFVEENNNSHIRAYVGRSRYDTLAQVKALNALYRLLDMYHNLFQSVMRTVPDASGKKTTVATPFQRLLAHRVLSPEATVAWQHFREALDPWCLREAIAQALEALDRLPNAAAGQVEDVHASIGLWKTGTTLRQATGCPPFPTTPAAATTPQPLPPQP